MSRYEGVADDDPTYYDRLLPPARPAGREAGRPAPGQLGFPTVPGLLDAARPVPGRRPLHPLVRRVRQPRRSRAGQLPGQHPPADPVATGPLKLIAAGRAPPRRPVTPQSGNLLGRSRPWLTPAVRVVSPDANRRLLSRGRSSRSTSPRRVAGGPRLHGREPPSRGPPTTRSTRGCSGSSCSTRSTPTGTPTGRSTRPVHLAAASASQAQPPPPRPQRQPRHHRHGQRGRASPVFVGSNRQMGRHHDRQAGAPTI